MIERQLVDRVVAAVLMIVGAAQFWGGFTMDRLTIRKIHPASIPGLLPMFLGIAMFLLALIVYRASLRPGTSVDDASVRPDGAPSPVLRDDGFSATELRRVLGIALLAGIYALLLVGHLHFWLASALFVFTFVLVTEFGRYPALAGRARLALVALTVAVTVTGGITWLFEKGFLVRLP